MLQVRRQQIEAMLLFGAFLYVALGGITYAVGEVRAPLAYLGFAVHVLLNASFFFLLRWRGGEGNLASYLAALSCTYALTHVYFFYPAGRGGVFHAIMSLGMLIAVVDVSVLIRRPAALLLQGNALFLTVVVLSTVKEFGGALAGAPIALLLIWKFALFFHYRVTQSEREKLRQLEAFRATVVTLNHEFNNVAAICQVLLAKLRSAGYGSAPEGDDLNMLERTLLRLVKSVKSLRKLERYEEVEYLSGRKMVALEQED